MTGAVGRCTMGGMSTEHDAAPEGASSRTQESTLSLDWHAHYEREAGERIMLKVTGKGNAPTPGWRLELHRQNPQGINPKDLLLHFVAHRPTGIEPQIVTAVSKSWSEQVASADQFDTVTILPAGKTIHPRPLKG